MESAQKIVEELDQIKGRLASVSNLLWPIKEQSIRLADAWQQAKACHDEIRAIINRNNDEEQSHKLNQEKVMEQAIEIIRNSKSYAEAYTEMVDAGFDPVEADGYWAEFQNQCGLNVED